MVRPKPETLMRSPSGLIHIPGTKTERSECYLPMAPALQAELAAYLETRTDDSPYLFPGRSAQTNGKKIYSRRPLFKKIQRVTAFTAYIEKNSGTLPDECLEGIEAVCDPGGVKLITKELRDYFVTQLSAQVSDPNTVKELMRHTSLTTTSRYVRTVTERMNKLCKIWE